MEGLRQDAPIIRNFGYTWYFKNLLCLERPMRNLSQHSQHNPTKIRTRHLINTCLECYNHINQFREAYSCKLHSVTHMLLFLWDLTPSVASMRLKVKEVRYWTYLKSGSCVVAGCLMTSHYCSLHWGPQMEVEALEYQNASARAAPCHLHRDDLWWWHLVLPHYCMHDDVS
jgi:hypothetical protein